MWFMHTLKEKIYQKIYEMIFSQNLAPGSRLPGEMELCRMMGVSRVTLRNALSMLEKEGMISRSRQKGTVVRIPEQQPRKILVVVKEDHNQTGSPELEMISGISARCCELGMKMDVLEYGELTRGGNLNEQYVGIIQSGCAFHGGEKILETLKQSGLPLVNAMAFESDLRITGQTTVLTNSYEAWINGLKFLLQFGHTRIAFLLNEQSIIEKRFNRSFEDFREALGQYCSRDGMFFLFPESNGHFYRNISALLEQPEPPSAFYCYKDAYLLDVYQMAKEKQRNIPEDIAVLGFSGGAGGALLRPSLSSVDFGYQRLGRIAVDVLLDHEKWETGKEKPVIYAPYSVIARESTDYFIINYHSEPPRYNAQGAGRK